MMFGLGLDLDLDIKVKNLVLDLAPRGPVNVTSISK